VASKIDGGAVYRDKLNKYPGDILECQLGSPAVGCRHARYVIGRVAAPSALAYAHRVRLARLIDDLEERTHRGDPD
jgi:hypothetical protein